MKTSHTPGPWDISRYTSGDKWIDILSPGVRVDYDDVNQAEQRANARLIAAAPELLAALEGALRRLERLGSEETGQCDCTDAARAAIAKATNARP